MCGLSCLMIIILLSNPASPQKEADSLILALKQQTSDTARIKLLCEISAQFLNEDAERGLMYGAEAFTLARKVEWEPGIQQASLSVGNCYHLLSRRDSAEWFYQNAVLIAERRDDKLGLANCYNVIGVQYQSTSNYPKALRNLHNALSLFHDLSKPEGEAVCYGNIGTIYDNQRQFEKALDNYNKALKLYKLLGDKEGLTIILTNVGNLHKQQGDLGKALQIEHEALEMAESLGAGSLILNNLTNLGSAYSDSGNYEKALQYQEKALTLASQNHDPYYQGVNHGNIGTTYYVASSQDSSGRGLKVLGISKSAALRKAVEHLTIAIDSLESQSALNELSFYYDIRHRAQNELGDSLAAARDFQKYTTYHDSVFSQENSVGIANLESELRMQIADKQMELDASLLERKRLERIYFAAGIVLLLIVVFFIGRERKRSEHLLLNILPAKIAARLKKDEHPIADAFDKVSIIFIDMAGFTSLMREKEPKYTVSILNELFTRFDTLAEKHGIEKIKTIGDCYMAVAGLPDPQIDYANRVAAMAIEVQSSMHDYLTPDGRKVAFRIGIDCGPVVAGVIGQRKFIYDLWGDPVNTASRMQSTGVPGEIHCTQRFREAVGNGYRFTLNGCTEIKGIGAMETWLLNEMDTIDS